MPVVTFDYNDFLNLLGYKLSKEKFLERIPMIGADLDRVEGDSISIEFFPNRPDLLSVEGIARAAKTFFGFEKGLRRYKTEKTDILLKVDPSVKKVRPFIVTALVKNVEMTDELISSLMDMQEKLHFGLGRERKKVAIGVHDFDQIKPPFIYKAVKPKSIKFVPLAKTEEMNLEEILEKHEKGVAYAHLLKGFDRYPIILDKNNNVLSFPPIINGSLTEVTPFTKNLFIDVTGNDLDAMKFALNILVTALAERGGKIFTTIVEYDDKKIVTPDLKPDIRNLSVDYVNKILGTKLSKREIIESLLKMGYDVDVKEKEMRVYIPAWRADILHQIDLVEDVAIGYGFDRFKTELPKSMTFGKELEYKEFHTILRNILIGLGFNEVVTLSLTNEDDEYKKMGLNPKSNVKIENPIGEEYSIVRSSLIPSLLKILSKNKHNPLPQKIFEIGIVADENAKNRWHLAATQIDAKVGFSDCKALIEATFRDAGIKWKIEEDDHPAFIKGRCASILVKNKKIGIFGEIHPKTITAFELEHPLIAFEIDIESF
ncbi:MAG TPA: phenylalanine--tRNA ligase subunit beta [Thermoplasmatales archaeon]|nr:phenylalanine--tRNA ligase subunit beta [Thermoplasmatales archaeon]HEX08524.1 phenylalanine--tRNA ligase subunit beta [Thermoplasmatales archaeon]